MEANLAQTIAACQLEQRKHVVNVGMHTAVRQQTENVQSGIEPLALVDRAHQSRILEEIAVLDGLGDTAVRLDADIHHRPASLTDLLRHIFRICLLAPQGQ